MDLTFKDVTNPFVLEACRKFPDRLAGGIRLVPTAPDAITELRKYADTGFFKFVKLFPPQQFRADDERIAAVLRGLRRVRAAGALPHGADQRGVHRRAEAQAPAPGLGRTPTPSTSTGWRACSPSCRLIIAHNGYPYFLESWAVALAHPNVYLDIAGSGPWTEGIPVVYTSLGGAAFIPIDFDRRAVGIGQLPAAEGEHRPGRDVPAPDGRGQAPAREHPRGDRAEAVRPQVAPAEADADPAARAASIRAGHRSACR